MRTLVSTCFLILITSSAFSAEAWQPSQTEKDGIVAKGLAEMEASLEDAKESEACLTTGLRIGFIKGVFAKYNRPLPKMCYSPFGNYVLKNK